MALELVEKRERVCIWVKADLNPCLKPSIRGTDYCWYHTPLASSAYNRDVQLDVLADDEADVLRKQWKDELDAEVLESKRNRKHRDKKTKHLRASDFPKWIDGLRFDSIDEYYLFHTGSTFEEMAGTDIEFFSRNYPARSSYGQYGQGNIQFPTGGGYSPFTSGSYQSRPHKRLDRGTYKLVETIEHMRYVVVRLENGKYHAVFVSMNLPLPENGLALIMAAVQKTELPCGVTETPWGRFHSTGPAKEDYWDAESRLQRGGETFYKTRDRLAKAKDPNWVPPNLRQLAINGDYQYIPAEYHAWLKQWVKDGCKGWWASKTPQKKSNNRISKLFDISKRKGAS